MNNANKKFKEQFKNFKTVAISLLTLELLIMTIVFTVKASMAIGGGQEAVEHYSQSTQNYASQNYVNVVDVVSREPAVVKDISLDYADGGVEEEQIITADDYVE